MNQAQVLSTAVYRISRTLSLKYPFYIIDIAYSNYGTVCLSVTNTSRVSIRSRSFLSRMQDVKVIVPTGSYIDVSPIGHGDVDEHFFFDKTERVCSSQLGFTNVGKPSSFITYLNDNQLKPHGIAISKSGGILMCLWNRKYSDQSAGKVVKLYQYYEIVLEIESDKNIPMFVFPSYKAENGNGDICVSDVRTVVVTDAGGMLRFRYQGNSSDSNFDPYGICCDSTCNIIVADMKNNIIHLIDKNGDFLYHVIYEGIRMPRALCIDENDNLYVAEWYTDSIKVVAR